MKISTATENKSLRATWDEGPSRLSVGFLTRGADKSNVALGHENLPDLRSVAMMKAYWIPGLERLKAFWSGRTKAERGLVCSNSLVGPVSSRFCGLSINIRNTGSIAIQPVPLLCPAEGRFNVSDSAMVGHVMLALSSMPMNSRLLLPFLAAALVATPLLSASGLAQSSDRRAIGPDTIVVLPVSGEITKATHIFLRRALKTAERANAKAVILEMDTYGGDLAATSDIQKALLSVTVPTYTFINTNAGSAGALISIATKQIWMAPVSTIGAAAPVSGGGQDLENTMREKVTSYFSARARSIAEQQGHNPDIAEAFMNKEKEVKIGDEIINPKGTLLTLSANSAARWINGKPVLAQGIATSLADLAKQAGIDAPMITIEPTGFEKMAQIIASLAPLFLLGGLVCAYLEFKIPGATLPGVLAVVFFGLFFGGHYLAGLAGFEIIALFLLGVMLILVELVFFPGVILPAVIGAGLMLVAIVLAMADRYPNQPLLPSLDQLALPLINLGLALAFAALAITILMSMLPKTSMYRRFVLAAAVEGGSAGPLVAAGSVLSGLGLGLTGVTRTPLHPAGKAQFGDTIVDVVSEGGFVETGVEVRIEQIEGARVMVATKRAAAPDVRG